MRKKFTIFLILTFILGLVPVNFSVAITKNQIDAEVQIVCTDGNDNWFSGSGTIIDPKGIILTNRHVVDGAYMNTCFIGFIESIGQEPNFGTSGNYNLAEVKYQTTSNDMDAAILYLDNPTNKIYPYVNIWNSNSDALQFGDKIEVIGFPSIGGSTITYTSGDFSGFGSDSKGTQNYIKTTAPLEHGNSGGGAYNLSGQFVGIPTMVVAGSLNSMSYILSVNSIKSWLSGILGSGYQGKVIEQKPSIKKSVVNIQNDITPPTKPSNLHVHCYTDFTKSSYISLGSGYIDHNNYSQSYISTIYCEWNGLIDPSGVAGYYVYFGENINARPAIDGIFTTHQEVQHTFNSKGRYRFIVQAKDNAGNISEPIDFGAYHYLMLDEDKKNQEAIHKEVDQNKINNFYIYDYSNSSKGKLLKKIQLDSSKMQKIEVPSNNLLIEWDGITNSDFDTRLRVRFNKGKIWDECGGAGWEKNKKGVYYRDIPDWEKCILNEENEQYKVIKLNYITAVQLTTGDVYDFEFNYFYSYGRQSGSIHPFNLISTKQKNFEISNLINGLKGQILLQVENNGEAYYIYPDNNKRYYLGRPKDAFNAMRKLGLGATHEFITSNIIFPDNVLGKILLDVEKSGEAYYIYPKDKKAYYLGRPADAFRIMRELGLGITNNDLNKILEGNL